ncbi:MAG TPA: cache domain-containing protein, partial [Candidatus Merdenecus merdavium]|nr:cache domain-containing protein [Candidatus Merdenecus merdavium]
MKIIKGFLKKCSIQKQIQFLVIMVSVISTLVLGIGSFLMFRYTIEKNYKEDFRYNLEISNNIMDIQLENIVMLSRNILTNSDVMDLLEVSKNQEGKYFNSEQTHELEKVLSSMMYQDTYMAEVAVIDHSGKIYGSHKNLGATSYKKRDDILETDFIQKAKSAKGKEIFFSGNVLDTEKSPYTFSMVKELRNPFGQNEMGFLVINIRKKILDTSFVTLKGSYKSNSFFILGNDHSTAY